MRNGSQSESTLSSIPSGVACETYHSAGTHEIPADPAPTGRFRCYKVGSGVDRRLGYHQGMEIVERPADTLIDLTPVAAEKVRELMAEEPDADALVLRVAIQGG